ncbi:hypothetical protein [Bacillus gaemokensis]|uniref:Phr family secreted Rap phosphatase inhibitor n=1 Tax=Bacillus gaemokensis TaxID=574375 RepID=A0A073KEJ6_9BACI|nr:hypothetical protein [Bacillus gaemokensis]KEK25699.1 hypothetical protein BAGA_00180 [Bacillus gaemokensis]KYG38516.1 hypothetical protein AZF08_00345 [Bacillus gaemokensis]
MKKIVLSALGFVFTLSILGTNTFSATSLNKGDGGAPARPDLVYNVGDGGAPANADADGDTGGSQQETNVMSV